MSCCCSWLLVITDRTIVAQIPDTAGSLHLTTLEEPPLCVGKAGSLINLNPSSLRFWSKLGLTPRSGSKDVTAYLLYDDRTHIASAAASWLRRVSEVYSVSVF